MSSRKIQLVLFSRNRSCQLDLLLRSLAKNAPDLFEVDILYKADDEFYQRGYDLLWSRLTEPVFNGISANLATYPEKDFALDLKFLIEYNSEDNPFLAYGTDDEICFRNVYEELGPDPYGLIESVLNHHETNDAGMIFSGFSLRMGKQTTIQDYSRNAPISRWNYNETDKFIFWCSKSHSPCENPGYALSLDATIFHRDTILPLINKVQFSNPNQLEGALSQFSHTAEIGDFMAAPKHSLIFCNTLNVTASSYGAPNGRFHPMSLEELNLRYLNGEIFDLEAMNFDNVVSTHQEILPQFKKV
jgi:hypothetical protein